jgi:two-component system, chemotaxis family, CheB/CheR fusion protein
VVVLRSNLSLLPRLDGVTILLAEDHPDSLDVMRQTLESFGARVLPAAHGQQALRILSTAKVDVILADLRMPVMDGFELGRRVRANPRWARAPLVAVTALGDYSDYMRTLELGFDAHVVKPIDYDALVAVLWRLLPRVSPPSRRPPRRSRGCR